jgi:hypothetical protein
MVNTLGFSPSEYWKLSPVELMVILEDKRPKEIGGIHEDDYYRMIERRKELESQGIKVL